MTNLDIQSAYVGTDQVVKVYLGTEVIYEEGPSYMEFNEWYAKGSISRTLGNTLLVKQNSTIWTKVDEVGYLSDTSMSGSTGSSHYAIQILHGSPAQMPFQYHDSGSSTWTYLLPTSTETINGETFDRYDLPVNVYLAGDTKSYWASYVPQGNLYLLPPTQ